MNQKSASQPGATPTAPAANPRLKSRLADWRAFAAADTALATISTAAASGVRRLGLNPANSPRAFHWRPLMRVRKLALFTAAAATVLALPTAQVWAAGGPMMYTTASSFYAAAGTLVGPTNFSSISTGNSVVSGPITLAGVTFTDTLNNDFVVGVYANSFYGSSSIADNRNAALTFTLASNVTAFGFYTGEFYNGDSASYSVTLSSASGSSTLSGTVGSGQSAFVGFVSPSGFTSATATYNGGEYSLDNFSVTPVPEPSTKALALFALGSAGVLARRKRRASVAAVNSSEAPAE